MDRKAVREPSITGIARRLIRNLFIPIISLIILYLDASYLYFMNDALSSQQARFEAAAQASEQIRDNAEQFFYSVESIPELTYILDTYSEKKDVLYALLKTLRPQLENMVLNNPAISDVRIYSIRPLLLRAEPLHAPEELELSAAEAASLSSRYGNRLAWRCTASGDPGVLPKISAVYRQNGYNYVKPIGYIEAGISDEALAAFCRQFTHSESYHGGAFSVYQDDTLIYTDSFRDSPLTGRELERAAEKGSLFLFRSLRYVNCVSFPELSLRITITGSVSSLSGGIPLVLLAFQTVILFIVAALLIRYYRNMKSLALRISEFSGFMETASPEMLTEYRPDAADGTGYIELTKLVEAYNRLILNNRELQRRLREMEHLTEESRYQVLQAQIHPHFIYGTLENIRMLAFQNHDRDAASMIYALSNLIRRTISISSDAVSLREELDAAHDYLKIQQIRFGGRFTYAENVSVDPDAVFLPSFTLQPLLENAIIHGVSKTDEDCLLTLTIARTETRVKIVVHNTGPAASEDRLNRVNLLLAGGLDPEDFEKDGHGRALYNIRERLRIVSEGEASIRLDRDFSGTAVLISLPADRFTSKEEGSCFIS